MHWTRDQLLAALNLYHRTPFGRQHSTNPHIIEFAEIIDRSPAAVAMKLNNFTSLDPAELGRGIKGLTGASRADRAIWDEFAGRMNDLAVQSESALERFGAVTKNDCPTSTAPDQDQLSSGPSETFGTVKIRRQQSFFRRAVLASYGYSCCITGNPVAELLRASHIIPWAENEERRADPTNGLALAATFDAAFDRGLISFDEDLRLILSPRLENYLPNPELEATFLSARGRRLILPEKNFPDTVCLAWHRRKFGFS